MASKERTRRTASPKVPPTPEELGLDEVDAASADSMDASDPPAFGGATGVGAAAGNGGERRELIAARAYELWREAGSPEGVALEYWLAAEREFDRMAADERAGT